MLLSLSILFISDSIGGTHSSESRDKEENILNSPISSNSRSLILWKFVAALSRSMVNLTAWFEYSIFRRSVYSSTTFLTALSLSFFWDNLLIIKNLSMFSTPIVSSILSQYSSTFSWPSPESSAISKRLFLIRSDPAKGIPLVLRTLNNLNEEVKLSVWTKTT